MTCLAFLILCYNFYVYETYLINFANFWTGRPKYNDPNFQFWLLPLSVLLMLRGPMFLKPQDSFGRFVFKNSRSSESGLYHQKAPLNPPAIVLNDIS